MTKKIQTYIYISWKKLPESNPDTRTSLRWWSSDCVSELTKRCMLLTSLPDKMQKVYIYINIYICTLITLYRWELWHWA